MDICITMHWSSIWLIRNLILVSVIQMVGKMWHMVDLLFYRLLTRIVKIIHVTFRIVFVTWMALFAVWVKCSEAEVADVVHQVGDETEDLTESYH